MQQQLVAMSIFHIVCEDIQCAIEIPMACTSHTFVLEQNPKPILATKDEILEILRDRISRH